MNKHFLKYIASLLLFGSNGIVASYIALSSYEIVYLRTMIGSLFLLVLFLLLRQKWNVREHRKELGYIALSGFAMGIGWIFLYEAYQQVGVGTASLLYYCGPVIVMALTPFFFKESLTRKKCLGFAIVLLGILFVNGQAFQEGKTGWGLFCGGMAAILYAVLVIANKKAVHISGMENSMLQLIFSFLAVAVFLCFRQGLVVEIPTGDLLPVLFLGLVNTGVGCYLYFSAIGHLQAQTVAVCGYLEPLSAVVFSAVLLGESMMLLQAAGVAFIIGGALFAEISTGKPVLVENNSAANTDK